MLSPRVNIRSGADVRERAERFKCGRACGLARVDIRNCKGTMMRCVTRSRPVCPHERGPPPTRAPPALPTPPHPPPAPHPTVRQLRPNPTQATFHTKGKYTRTAPQKHHSRSLIPPLGLMVMYLSARRSRGCTSPCILTPAPRAVSSESRCAAADFGLRFGAAFSEGSTPPRANFRTMSNVLLRSASLQRPRTDLGTDSNDRVDTVECDDAGDAGAEAAGAGAVEATLRWRHEARPMRRPPGRGRRIALARARAGFCPSQQGTGLRRHPIAGTKGRSRRWSSPRWPPRGPAATRARRRARPLRRPRHPPRRHRLPPPHR